MLSPLIYALAAGALSATPAPILDDPPIRLRLSEEHYEQGDHARVRVKTLNDGYLLVLRADGAGRVRVLFPLDPDDEGAIRGGREFEIVRHGDHEAFSVDEREGTGTVLAVRSDQPFDFSEFERNGHWDFRKLAFEQGDSDPEAALLDLVDRMAGDQHYDYDLATYTVTPRSLDRYRAGWADPWFWGCFGCYPWYAGPAWGGGWGFRATVGFGHSRPWAWWRRHR
jgi:hypothetical protein